MMLRFNKSVEELKAYTAAYDKVYNIDFRPFLEDETVVAASAYDMVPWLVDMGSIVALDDIILDPRKGQF